MIPIAKPFLDKEEAAAATEAILSGWVTQGPKVKEFEDAFAKYTGSRFACAVSSCTTALHLALLAAGVKSGDVVITVSHSFIATANAVRYCGAEPVFADIDTDTFNISPESVDRIVREDCEIVGGNLFYKNIYKIAVGESPLKNLVNSISGAKKLHLGKVAAIMPVHQMGMPCDLSAVLRIAKKYKLPVIEDAACAIGSKIRFNGKWDKIGKPHSDIACFSFHPRKIITTGDGGMLTTNNPAHDRFFRLMRQHGMNIPDTARHVAKQVIFEEYVTTGFNYRMTDIQASVGIMQLKRLPDIIKERRRIAAVYKRKLKPVKWLKTPVESTWCKSNWQSYPVKIAANSPLSRDEIMQRLLDNGISTRRGIMNAHQETPYRSYAGLENSEAARDSVILLPLFYKMTDEQIDNVISRLIYVQ